jgi:type VII secretion integral membrane protein EccD
VTVVGSRRRVDATLPAGIPVAELLWDVVGMLGESSDGASARWALTRVGGQMLDPELALEDQGVVEGTMLFLRDIKSPAPDPVVDDYAERVAITVDAQGGRWAQPAAQLLLVGAAALCLFAAGLLVLLTGDRGLRTLGGLGGTAIAAVIGMAMAQLMRRRAFGGILILAGLPLWAAAGAGIAGEAGADSTGILAAALGTVAAGSWVAILIGGDAVILPAVGLVAATLLPAAVLVGASAAGGEALAAAAVLAPLGLGQLALTPGLAARLANLAEPDPASIPARARRGRRLLAALLVGSAVVLTVSNAALAISGGWFAWSLTAVTSIAVVAKTRHFRFSAEVAPLIAAGLIGLVLLECSLVLQLAGPGRVGGTVAVLIVDGILLAAAAATIRGSELSPVFRRQLGRVELLATAATVPLALGVLGTYEAVARFAHGLH